MAVVRLAHRGARFAAGAALEDARRDSRIRSRGSRIPWRSENGGSELDAHAITGCAGKCP